MDKKLFLFVFIVWISDNCAHEYGLVGTCANSEKPVVLTDAYLRKYIYFVTQVHFPTGMSRRRHYFFNAAKGIGTDPNINFKKRKTMLFLDGYLDSTNYPFARIATGLYAEKGYNTITIDSQRIFTVIYPIAARNARVIGNVTAILLSQLMDYGLDPKDVELLGISLGGETVSFVGKYFYKLTGKKIGRIVSLDPAGPCYRDLAPEYRITASDADFVQVIHTDNEGFGFADANGHVDFYINGGEFGYIYNRFQPWCEDFCSHVVSFLYYYTSFHLYPDKFVGVRCKNVQQAREHRCYDNLPIDTNVMGLKVNTSNHGIFYIPVSADAPFFAPDDFIEKRMNYPLLYSDAFQSVENFVLK